MSAKRWVAQLADALLSVVAVAFVVGLVLLPVLLIAVGVGMVVGWSWVWEPNPTLVRIVAGVILVLIGLLAAGLLLRDLSEP